MESNDTMATVTGLLGQSSLSLERIGNGRNSRVYLADCGSSGQYAIKFYPDGGPGSRNRLQAEFSALTFLWEKGIRSIPEPVAANPESQCAAYRYLDGTLVNAANVGESDVREAVGFLVELNGLCQADGSEKLLDAADACFSTQALFDNIQVRADRLTSLQQTGSQYQELDRFMTSDFGPLLNRLHQSFQHRADESSEPLTQTLNRDDLTLSPSDFGFHNSIRRQSRRLAFLDFEYFGWDDPAKTICDFLLHPAMDLNNQLKRTFLAGIIDGFRQQPGLEARAKTLYPLYCLKWCMILLNAFLPEYLSQRELKVKAVDFQAAQLDKAQKMLAKAQGGDLGLFDKKATE